MNARNGATWLKQHTSCSKTWIALLRQRSLQYCMRARLRRATCKVACWHHSREGPNLHELNVAYVKPPPAEALEPRLPPAHAHGQPGHVLRGEGPAEDMCTAFASRARRSCGRGGGSVPFGTCAPCAMNSIEHRADPSSRGGQSRMDSLEQTVAFSQGNHFNGSLERRNSFWLTSQARATKAENPPGSRMSYGAHPKQG